MTSETQTERSESWAELSEQTELSNRTWRGELSSATSMADPESRRASSFTDPPKTPFVGQRRKDVSPLKGSATTEPTAAFPSATSSGGKSNQDPNVKSFSPRRRKTEFNSFDYWRADIEARENAVSTSQDSKLKTGTSTDPVWDNSRSGMNLHSPAGPSRSDDVSSKVSMGIAKGSGSIKGKGKDLTIKIPPLTPSPTSGGTALAPHPKSPKSGKKKERFEPVLRSASLSVPTGPISTHKKKKSKPSTPSKVTAKQKGTMGKPKESKVQEPQTPGETQIIEPSVATTSDEPETHAQSAEVEVKLTSDDTLSSEATSMVPRISTPYASGSYKDIVQDEVVLHCTAKDEKDGPDKVSLPSMSEFKRSLKLLQNRRTSLNHTQLSAVSQAAGYKKDHPPDHFSPEDKDSDSTIENIKDSNDTALIPPAQSAKSVRTKKRNKRKKVTDKAKGKEQEKSRNSSTSDVTIAVSRPAEFPSLPLDSPSTALGRVVDENKMLPPMEYVQPTNEGKSGFTESWLQQVEAQRATSLRHQPRRDIDAEMRSFDRERIEYQESKDDYNVERHLKFERLLNSSGLGINFGAGPAPKEGSFGITMPPTPSTATSNSFMAQHLTESVGSSGLSPVTVMGSGTPAMLLKTLPLKAGPPPKLEEPARRESPPLGGPSTPPLMSDEEAAAMARYTAKKADRVLELFGKDRVAGADAQPPPGFQAEDAKAGSAPKEGSVASSECSTEIDLALVKSSSLAEKPSGGIVNTPSSVGTMPSTPTKTGSSTVNLPASQGAVALRESSAELGTHQLLPSALTKDLAQENIIAPNENGKFILLYPKNNPAKDFS